MYLYKIRLKRLGRRKSPLYSIVVTFSNRSAKTGLIFEKLGVYLPSIKNFKIFFIKLNRLAYWLFRGAKITKAVGKLLGKMVPRLEKTRLWTGFSWYTPFPYEPKPLLKRNVKN